SCTRSPCCSWCSGPAGCGFASGARKRSRRRSATRSGEMRRIGLIAVALALPLILAACGGGSDSSSGSGSRSGPGTEASANAKPNEVSVKIIDLGCDPAALDLPAGPTTFKVQNDGASKVSEFELLDGDHILGEAENIAPGLSGEFSVTLRAGN